MKRIIVALFLSAAFAATASAQATRTWVSGVGDDANPCSRTAPCKTFAGAISKTAMCGEINAIDPGGFGAVTITKGITINGAGTMASILHSGTNGVVINITNAADTCKTVILRNLSINGTGTTIGLSSVKLLGSVATNLHLEHVDIEHSNRGVEIAPTVSGSRVYMKDVDIRRTTVNGIDLTQTAGITVKLSLDRVRSLQSTGSGLRLGTTTDGTIVNSLFQGNATGINIVNNTSHMSIAETVISENTGTGLLNGGTATTVIDGCTITGNGTGILNNTGGTVLGFGNNGIAYNGADVTGTAVSTIAHP